MYNKDEQKVIDELKAKGQLRFIRKNITLHQYGGAFKSSVNKTTFNNLISKGVIKEAYNNHKGLALYELTTTEE